jgi:geranylgeranyl reductase family protein
MVLAGENCPPRPIPIPQPMCTVHDCLIIGAGPAGATAAYRLARAGHDVVLLEQAPIPRPKPCGGGVQPQVARWLDFDLAPAISARVTRLRATWRLGEAAEGDLETREPLLMVRRESFDQHIVRKAAEQGAAVRDGLACGALRLEADAWTLETAAGPVRGRYLVAADGALGRTRQQLGFAALKHAAAGALEGEAACPMAGTTVAHLDFGTIAGGYLWNFPKADGWSLGGAVFRGPRPRDLRALVDGYARAFGIGPERMKVAGHPLHLWDGDQPLHTERALLAGEAACLVDPFTGGGILPAVQSGALAADAVHQALGTGPEALAGYSRRIHREWGRDMVWARRLANLFYRAPRLAYRLVVQREGAMRAMGQVLVGEVTYASLVRRVVGWLA